MSCRGWSSDAYWAARVSVELERAGHHVILACRLGTQERVIDRARAAGVRHIETLSLPGRGEAGLGRRRPAAAASVAARRRRGPRAPGQGALAGRHRQSALEDAAPAGAHAPHRPAGTAACAEPLALSQGHQSHRHGERGHPAPAPGRGPGATRARARAPGRGGRRDLSSRPRRAAVSPRPWAHRLLGPMVGSARRVPDHEGPAHRDRRCGAARAYGPGRFTWRWWAAARST